ncbi:hypothetical protein BDR22DRAFT_893224 [Usnea florida]
MFREHDFHHTWLWLYILLYLHPCTATHHLCSASHIQVRNLVLAPQNVSSGAPLTMERFYINPNLVILMSVSGPVGNTSALSLLLVDAATYARSNVLRHGASTVLPGRISRSESNLEYDLQPPLPRTSSRFTWGQYEALTDWL